MTWTILAATCLLNTVSASGRPSLVAGQSCDEAIIAQHHEFFPGVDPAMLKPVFSEKLSSTYPSFQTARYGCKQTLNGGSLSYCAQSCSGFRIQDHIMACRKGCKLGNDLYILNRNAQAMSEGGMPLFTPGNQMEQQEREKKLDEVKEPLRKF